MTYTKACDIKQVTQILLTHNAPFFSPAKVPSRALKFPACLTSEIKCF